MKRHHTRCLTALAMVLAVIVSLPMALAQQVVPELPQKSFEGQTAYRVVRAIDGDTFVASIDGKETTIRLIGVDTPETVHPQKALEAYGKEASLFTKNLLEGEAVYLEYETGASRLDKYGRTLAYAYRAPDGLFVNLEIIRQGYGHAYTTYPFQYMQQFRATETKARETGRGLWAAETGSQDTKSPVTTSVQPQASGSAAAAQDDGTTVYITRTGKKYHRAGCRYLAKSMIPLSLKEAKERGYGPCSVCGPPVVQSSKQSSSSEERKNVTVYITRTGSKYHRAGCRYLSKSSIPISLKDARQQGYTPCSVCNPTSMESGTSSSYTSSPSTSSGDKTVHVKGYYRKKGTYVKPYDRSAPRRSRK